MNRVGKMLTLIPNIYFKLHQPDDKILILKVANELNISRPKNDTNDKVRKRVVAKVSAVKPPDFKV